MSLNRIPFVVEDKKKPYIPNLKQKMELSFSGFKNTLFYQQKNKKPYLFESEPLPVIEDPYPYGLFIKEDDNKMKLNINNILNVLNKPYPLGLFIKEPNVSLYLNVKDVDYFGAFRNCVNLRTIKIPSTVQYIGPHAFENTALTEVILASECKYYSTSFPEGCKIRDINGNSIEPID